MCSNPYTYTYYDLAYRTTVPFRAIQNFSFFCFQHYTVCIADLMKNVLRLVKKDTVKYIEEECAFRWVLHVDVHVYIGKKFARKK